jgi:hypothetical protein
MDPQRFDRLARMVARRGSRRQVLAGLLAAAVAGLVPKRAAAQDLGDAIRDAVASAGNGGVADASANGGAVSIQNINSGGNAGNALGIGDTVGGPVTADGGDIANVTDIGVTADGGTAIADASGGDNNLAIVDVGNNNQGDDEDKEECRDEGQTCDHNPECCGSLVCCNDHCRHPNDEQCVDDDKECPATCPLCEECDTATGRCVAVTCPSPTVCCPSGTTAGQCLLPDNAECSALDPNSPECCSGACFPVGNPPQLRCVS